MTNHDTYCRRSNLQHELRAVFRAGVVDGLNHRALTISCGGSRTKGLKKEGFHGNRDVQIR